MNLALKFLIILLMIPLLVGCGIKTKFVTQEFIIGGRQVTYIVGSAKDFLGPSIVVMDRYDDKGALITKDVSTSMGIGNNLLQQAASSSAAAAVIGSMVKSVSPNINVNAE